MKKISIQVASAPDRENLVVEIWKEANLIAEINCEQSEPFIEFYSCEEQLSVPFNDFFTALVQAKEKADELFQS